MVSATRSRHELIAAYKASLRRFIDQRPSGIRLKIAEVTGTHKSFISQITNPADPTPLPARHIDAIFEVCHLSPDEQTAFLADYNAAHPEHAALERTPHRHMRTLHVQVPVLDDEKKQKALESLIRDTARRVSELMS